MEWLFSLALLPLLLCGAMCFGGMALAALGLRRTQQRPDHVSGRAEGPDTATPEPRALR